MTLTFLEPLLLPWVLRGRRSWTGSEVHEGVVALDDVLDQLEIAALLVHKLGLFLESGLQLLVQVSRHVADDIVVVAYSRIYYA